MSPSGKLFLKFLVAITFIACMGPFTFLKGEDGRPLMSFKTLTSNDFSRTSKYFSDFSRNISAVFSDLLSDPEKELVPVLSTDDLDQMYTWVDNSGMRHFSYDKPDGRSSEQIYINSGLTMTNYEKERDKIAMENQILMDQLKAKKEKAHKESLVKTQKIPDKVTLENLNTTLETLQTLQSGTNSSITELENY